MPSCQCPARGHRCGCTLRCARVQSTDRGSIAANLQGHRATAKAHCHALGVRTRSNCACGYVRPRPRTVCRHRRSWPSPERPRTSRAQCPWRCRHRQCMQPGHRAAPGTAAKNANTLSWRRGVCEAAGEGSEMTPGLAPPAACGAGVIAAPCRRAGESQLGRCRGSSFRDPLPKEGRRSNPPW